MAAVLADESGENKQDTIIPVPAPVKNLRQIFRALWFPLLFPYLSIVPFLNPPFITYQEKRQIDRLYLQESAIQDNVSRFPNLKPFDG